MSKYPKFVTFWVKSNKYFLKKVSIVRHKKDKKLRIALLFSEIAFIIIATSLDLTKKSNRLDVFANFSNIEGEIGWFQR